MKNYILVGIIFLLLSACSNSVVTTDSSLLSTKDKDIATKGILIQKGPGLMDETAYDIAALYDTAQIIEGIVIDITPAVYTNSDDLEIVYKDVIIEVTKTLKGDNYDKIAIRRIGGMAVNDKGEPIQYITHYPHFESQEKVLLFLNKVVDPIDMAVLPSEQYFQHHFIGKWTINSRGHYINELLPNQKMKIKKLEKALKQ